MYQTRQQSTMKDRTINLSEGFHLYEVKLIRFEELIHYIVVKVNLSGFATGKRWEKFVDRFLECGEFSLFSLLDEFTKFAEKADIWVKCH
jgi:hypothetical protein